MILLCAATPDELLAAVPASLLPHEPAGLPLLKPLPLRLGTTGQGVACVTGVGPINAALGMGIDAVHFGVIMVATAAIGMF